MSAAPTDQASRLRDLMSARDTGAKALLPPGPRAARVVAIASGKGGVGKTNVAVNLALCLARRGQRVVLVDADLGTANVDVVMNIRAPHNLSDVVRGRRAIDEVMFRVRTGLHVVTGASGMASLADMEPLMQRQLLEQLSRLERDSDVILLDCGAGVSQSVLAFACAADEVCVVMTPEPPAMTDAYALLKAICGQSMRPALSLLVNQAASRRDGIAAGARVEGVAARFLGVAARQIGQIPRDEHVGQAVRWRVPFVEAFPRCSAARALAVLAERVGDHAVGLAGRHGFFHRVARFFC